MNNWLYDFYKVPDYVAQHYRDKEKQREYQQKVDEAFYRDLGLWLRKQRVLKNYTIDRICRETGINNSDYHFYELGTKKIPLLKFIKFCRLLRIDFRYDGSFYLEPEELELVRAIRARDYRAVMEYVLRES